MNTLRCTECSATSIDGLLSHNDGCSAIKPNTITDYRRPPAIAIEFGSDKERKKFMKGLETSSSGVFVNEPSTTPTPDDSEMRQRLIARAHSPVGWAKYKKLDNGDYLMDGEKTDRLAADIVDYAIMEFKRILDQERRRYSLEQRQSELETFKKLPIQVISKETAAHISKRYAALQAELASLGEAA